MFYVKRIPYYEFLFEVTRSRGPGGQNVNRTNTAVILRWNPAMSQAFTEQEKQQIFQKMDLTQEGEVLIRSETNRSQDINKTDCLAKLDALLQKAFYKPKKRIKTRPTYSSKVKRLEGKDRRSQIKKNRGKIQYE